MHKNHPNIAPQVARILKARMGKARNKFSKTQLVIPVQGPKKWFAKCDKHYPSNSGRLV